MNLDELKEKLLPFRGTTAYYQGMENILYTDGIRKLIYLVGCYWFIDDSSMVIGNKFRKYKFVAVTLIVNEDYTGMIKYEDENGRVLYSQKYEYIDFPKGKFEIFYEHGVLLLPGEH